MRARKSASEEVSRLKEENERLTAENFDREKLAQDLETLESAFAFRAAADMALTGARVFFYTRELGREVLVIDQGASAGVKKGDAVIDAHAALVGEVDEAGDDYSRVLVASNAGVAFRASLLPGGGSMLARGLGARTFSLELIPRNLRLREGDFVVRRVTLPGGGNHTVPVASVLGDSLAGAAPPAQAGGFAQARAVLIARPETLERVFIIHISAWTE